MKRLENRLIVQCQRLRAKGNSFGEISSQTRIARSTLHAYLKKIFLSIGQIQEIEVRRKAKCKSKPNPRKGRCLAGREIVKPKNWSDKLVHIVAHFMFDGRVDEYSCTYYSKDRYQIDHMRCLLREVFGAKPRIKLRDNGVYGLLFHHVELASYIKDRQEKIFEYLNNGASLSSKKEFLKAFFDDEGNVYYSKSTRRVRGYQKSCQRLEVIKGLLSIFGISGRINKNATYIEITGRENLAKFSQNIDFSPRIYLNPERKNSIWGKKISKKRLLGLSVDSYKKNNF